MNIYGKIIDNTINIKKTGQSIELNGKKIINPTDEKYLEAGYNLLELTLAPERDEAYCYYEQSWKIVDGEIVCMWTKISTEEEELKRIANLSMTRGDFFRGVYNALGLTREALRSMITNFALDGFTEQNRELALIDFDEGLNFVRGNQLISMLCANSSITDEQMTAFFETGNYQKLITQG